MLLFNKFLANDKDLSPIFEPISKIEKFSFPLLRDITFVKVSVIFFWKLPKINIDKSIPCFKSNLYLIFLLLTIIVDFNLKIFINTKDKILATLILLIV